MPTYVYKCSTCGKRQEAIRRISERKNGPECCNSPMNQILTAVEINPVILGGGKYHGYKCPITDQYITSRKERKNIMAEHDLIEKETNRKK